MYKLIIRVILLSIAVALILILLLRNRIPFGKGNSSFASEPGRDITRIELSESGKKLSLEKKGENWVINEKTEARKSGILFIIRILREIKIKSPVSDELFNSEIREKGIEPVRIKVYDHKKLIKSFLVYRTSSNNYGNIMKIREKSKPFIVYVPGYEGDIGSAFTLSDLFWQPYTVFNLLPSEISVVKLENISDSSSSFSIIGRNPHFTLAAGNRKLTGWDSALVTRYLSYFAWIPFEKWALEMGSDEKKLVESRQPLYRITVRTSTGKETVLTLWERMKADHGEIQTDTDRLLGKTQSDDEFFILRYFDIDPLLKKRSYFFPE
jgi:hypothetical protein